MIIDTNATVKLYESNYQNATSRLASSMVRLSSGKAFINPGEAPAELGISERFKAQIAKGEEANNVILNATNMFQTSDSFMQSITDMLDRMSELAVSSIDGSKNQEDRVNLDTEFQQLKTEIGRLSEAGKYNGLQINSNTTVSVWDAIDKQIVISQADGTEARQLGIEMRSGNTSVNDIHYAFETSSQGTVGDFTFSSDGRYLVYIAQQTISAENLTAQRTLMRLDIDNNTLATLDLSAAAAGGSANVAPRLTQDDQGRIWVTSPDSGSGAGLYSLAMLDVNNMELDYGGTSTSVWAGGVTVGSAHSQFAIHKNYAYFFETSTGGVVNFVRQNLFDINENQVLMNDVSALVGFNSGENYSISEDGQYFAFEDTNNSDGQVHLTIVNSMSQETGGVITGDRPNSVVAIDFDGNNNLYWTDTGTTSDKNTLNKARIIFGDDPILTDIKVLRNDNDGHLGAINSAGAALGLGMSVTGGNPSSRYIFQVGPDSGNTVDFVSSDARLVKLGVSRSNVRTLPEAQQALKDLQTAVDRISNQRAAVGAEVSRLGFILSANDSFINNLSQAESRISDVNFAKETSELTVSQIMAQTSTQILRQANSFKANVLALLQ